MDNCLSRFKKAKPTLLFLMFVTFIYAGGAVAVEQSVIEGARKEGLLHLYTAMEVSRAVRLLQEFKKKYPFLETQIYRSKGSNILAKINQETKAKRYAADVITASFPIWNDLKNGRFLMKYKSQETAIYPKSMKDPDDYWTVLYLQVQGMVYNSNMVSPEEAPKKYEDLLSPQWQGKKIAMDAQDHAWFAVMLEILGEERGLNFMRRLSKQELMLRENKTLLTNLLAAGEFTILANAYLDTTMMIKNKGAPVEWVPGSNPISSGTHLAGIYAHAPHPNSAKLYYDFLFSEEGQKIQSNMGIVVPRPGVESELTKKIKNFDIYPVYPSMVTKFSAITKQFRETFR